MILGAVTIRECIERVGMEDPFIVDEFAIFVTGSGAELVV